MVSIKRIADRERRSRELLWKKGGRWKMWKEEGEIRERAASARIYVSHAWEFMAANWGERVESASRGGKDGKRRWNAVNGRGDEGICYAQLLGLILG